MSIQSGLVRLAILVVGVVWAAPSRGATEQTCESLASLETCAEADVGKTCEGGGACKAFDCRNPDATVVFKCSCEPGIGVPEGGCPSDAATSVDMKGPNGCALTGQKTDDGTTHGLSLSSVVAVSFLASARRRRAGDPGRTSARRGPT